MNGPCSVPVHRCGFVGPGVAGHHVLGRDANGDYVLPEILLPLCQPDCHQGGIHRAIQAEGLDGPMEATPGVIVGRVACTFGYLTLDREGEVVLACDLLADVADVLGAIGRVLRRTEESLR